MERDEMGWDGSHGGRILSVSDQSSTKVKGAADLAWLEPEDDTENIDITLLDMMEEYESNSRRVEVAFCVRIMGKVTVDVFF
jgi:hypothetical protein